MNGAEPGRLVRDLRQRVGLTQRQLAIRAGTTSTAIGRLERGHVSPTVRTLERVLFCLGRRLVLATEPLPLTVDEARLEAVAHLSPDERLALVLASQAQLHGLLGAARQTSSTSTSDTIRSTQAPSTSRSPVTRRRG